MAKKMCTYNPGVDCADCTKCDKCGWSTARCKFNDGIACFDPAMCKSCGWNPANVRLRARRAINQLAASVLSTSSPTAA